MDLLIAFYSHVNYSVTKIATRKETGRNQFYSHVNYSVTKIKGREKALDKGFYSHVNYSVTKIGVRIPDVSLKVLQSRKLFSY